MFKVIVYLWLSSSSIYDQSDSFYVSEAMNKEECVFHLKYAGAVARKIFPSAVIIGQCLNADLLKSY